MIIHILHQITSDSQLCLTDKIHLLYMRVTTKSYNKIWRCCPRKVIKQDYEYQSSLTVNSYPLYAYWTLLSRESKRFTTKLPKWMKLKLLSWFRHSSIIMSSCCSLTTSKFATLPTSVYLIRGQWPSSDEIDWNKISKRLQAFHVYAYWCVVYVYERRIRQHLQGGQVHFWGMLFFFFSLLVAYSWKTAKINY